MSPMKHTGPVVVATDLSEAADEAVMQAHRWALAFDRELVVVHVVPDGVGQNPLFPQRSEGQLEAVLDAESRASGAVTERVAQLTGRDADTFRVIIGTGTVSRFLVEQAERMRAMLVVVGSRGLSGLQRLLLGSVAERVVELAHAPVLVARAKAAHTGIVLTGTDFSDAANVAVDAASEIVRRLQGRLALLHSLDIFPPPAFGVGTPFGASIVTMPPEAVLDVRAAAMHMLQEALTHHVGVNGFPVVEEGPSARALVRKAEELDADLVVVGTHGRTGVSRLLLGSVTETVVRAARCSVLVVRQGEGATLPAP
jgi:nucleotide-binding universal stress UspA family protein